MTSDHSPVYKICPRHLWQAAMAEGRFEGSEHDRRDGFIHLSATHQLAATAERHFSGQADLLLIAVDPRRLGTALKWEPSRGGDLFPHLYAPLPAEAVLWERPLPLRSDGIPDIQARLTP